MIDHLNPISSIASITGKQRTEAASVNDEMSFGLFEDVFRSAIENVKTTNYEKTEAQYLLSTGQLDNPAALTIASTKSQIAVELLVQMRNKALEAYQGLTSIAL